jgi:hypothetical protein
MEKQSIARSLFAGYFHQDWDIYDQDWRIALTKMLPDFSVNDLEQLALEIHRLLTIHSEQELEDMLYPTFGCYFVPAGAGLTNREWFAELISIIENTLQQRKGNAPL